LNIVELAVIARSCPSCCDFSFRQWSFAYNIFLIHTFGAGSSPAALCPLFGCYPPQWGCGHLLTTLEKPVAKSTVSPENPSPSPPFALEKPVARSTIALPSSPRPTPRSAAKPRAGGADALAASGRRKVASVRGPHSRGFAREPPAPDFPPDGSYLADLGRACAGGSRPTEPPRNHCGSVCDSSATS
jgi:hypothetical protein